MTACDAVDGSHHRHLGAKVRLLLNRYKGSRPMSEVTTIGLDLAKSGFQVHGVDQAGEVVVSKQLRRRQMIPFFEKLPTRLIGMEACATSHHWARELGALAREVRHHAGGLSPS